MPCDCHSFSSMLWGSECSPVTAMGELLFITLHTWIKKNKDRFTQIICSCPLQEKQSSVNNSSLKATQGLNPPTSETQPFFFKRFIDIFLKTCLGILPARESCAGVRSSGTGVAGSCELPIHEAEKQTWDLWKIIQHSQLLSYRSGPWTSFPLCSNTSQKYFDVKYSILWSFLVLLEFAWSIFPQQ